MRGFRFMANTGAATVKRAIMFISCIWIVLLAGSPGHAAELSPDKPILLVGQEIEAVLDIRKKEVRIIRFSVDKMLPTGRLQHQLAKPYTLRLVSAPKKIEVDKITTFKASDWYDGIGLKLDIKIYLSKAGEANGSINITSQHEETSLYYSAQQLDVRQQ